VPGAILEIIPNGSFLAADFVINKGWAFFARSKTNMDQTKGCHRAFFRAKARKLEVIAHRGGADEVPGETIFAFEHARRIKADVLEMDVHSTRDGRFVLMHNKTVDETTDGSGPVHGFDFRELGELDAGFRWTADGGKTFPFRRNAEPGLDIRVPTLEEVFEKFGDYRMIIEIKQTDPSIVTPLGELIRRFGMTEKVLVAAMRHRPLKEFRRQFPEIATSASWLELLKFVTLNFLVPGIGKIPEADAVQIGIRFGGILLPFVNRRTVRAARLLDLPIQPWTVNRTDDMQRMIALGVDGIITDKPETLLEILARN
jgi:glycerophosphoryl diester phosphodiesterase